MGNKTPRGTMEGEEGKEMFTSASFKKSELDVALPDINQLSIECQELRDRIEELAEAIDDIFEEREEPDESTSAMESKLQTMTRNNQLRIHQLHKYLERHSKLASIDTNSQIMTLVKHLVSIVNNYMTMLMRNIQKLKRLLEEFEATGDMETDNLSNYRQKSRPGVISTTGNRIRTRKGSKQVDVISEQHDVDAMLSELCETEMFREELERDIVIVLVYWRDFKDLANASTQVHSLEDGEGQVALAAAESIANGLRQIDVMKR